MIRLIIVRHAECEANARKIIAGHSDYKLTGKGIEQAKKVALRLKNEKIDKAFVSDIKRAKDTAKEILKYHKDVKVVHEKRIRERNYGVFEGMPRGSVRKAAEEKKIKFNEFKPEKGESVKEVRQRVVEFLDEILDKEQGKTILMAAHGGPILELLFHLLKLPEEQYQEYHPETTAVTIIEFDAGKKHKVHLLNCTNHLK